MQTFGIGAFVIDFQVWGNDANYFVESDLFSHGGIQIGQFDVPFGIDWHVYPSIDRKLISSPVAVTNTHAGWNDFGLNLYLENDFFNLNLFGVNGYDNAAYLELTDAKTKMAVGARAGIKTSEFVEIGVSGAGFLDDKKNMNRTLSGLDVQLSLTKIELKGEYIYQEAQLGKQLISSGYYAQGQYSFDLFYLVARYGSFSDRRLADIKEDRFSLAAGIEIIEGCSLRFENQFSKTDYNGSIMQIVVGF